MTKTKVWLLILRLGPQADTTIFRSFPFSRERSHSMLHRQNDNWPLSNVIHSKPVTVSTSLDHLPTYVLFMICEVIGAERERSKVTSTVHGRSLLQGEGSKKCKREASRARYRKWILAILGNPLFATLVYTPGEEIDRVGGISYVSHACISVGYTQSAEIDSQRTANIDFLQEWSVLAAKGSLSVLLWIFPQRESLCLVMRVVETVS